MQVTDQRQAIPVGHEGAQFLADGGRQHGPGLAGEIGRAGAQTCFLFGGPVFGQQGCRVRNGDAEAPAALRERLGHDGVIHILGAGGVDGHEGQVRQVLPLRPRLLNGSFRECGHFLVHRLGPFIAQLVFGHGVAALNAGIRLVADDSENLGLGVAAAERVARHPGVDEVPPRFLPRCAVSGARRTSG